MNSLTTQLHVPAAEARAIGEALVGGKFTCPLGGKYVLVNPEAPVIPTTGDDKVTSSTAQKTEQLPSPDEHAAENASTDGRRLWVSTAPPAENRFLLTVIPADYQMPLMTWFRGLSADVARINDELWLNAKLDMVHIEVGPPEDPNGQGGGFGLPSLGNLISRFGAKKDEAVKSGSEALLPDRSTTEQK